MSLFQCEVCGCCENTALACQGFKGITECFDWSYAPEREGKRLCSACGPVQYANKEGPTEYGRWHGQFDRVFLPLGQFKTNSRGNLEHIGTGSEDYRSFAIESSDYDRLAQECEQWHQLCAEAQVQRDQYQDQRDAALKQVEGLRTTLEKISAYAPCSGVKDPGFTKMHMGILARDAIAELEADT